MPRVTAQPIRDAPTFLATRDIPAVDDDFVELWLAERSSPALLHSALNRDSDRSFTASAREQLRQALEQEGVDEVLADKLLAEVLASPSFAVQKHDGELEHVRQAVVFGRDDDSGLPLEMLVRVDVWVRSRHTRAGERTPVPAAVERTTVEAIVLDMEGDAQLGDAMLTYLRWLSEFPVPPRSARELTTSVVFLGNPTALGAVDVPEEWRQQLRQLAEAFGATATFHHGPSFTGTVGDRVRRVIRFDPWNGEEPVDSKGNEVPAEALDVRHLPFGDVYQRVAVVLASHVPEDEVSQFDERDLLAGEEIYHRKVGSNRRYDNFDAGGTSPCRHGRAAFIRWSGPKGTKGMAHRYSNFEPEWLHHCKKFPNCNVYAVFRPAD